MTSMTGGKWVKRWLMRSNFARKSVSMGPGDIGHWTRLVGGTCALFHSLALHFLFSNAHLSVTYHYRSDMSSPCWPVSCGLFPGGV